MGRKVSDGQSVKVVVPESTTITQGEFVLLGGFFGLAVRGLTTGAGETKEVVLNIESGEYETSQIAAEPVTFNAGDLLYFDAANKVLTTNDGAGANRLVGRVTVGADENRVIWFILGPQVV